MIDLTQIEGFDWNEGNARKNTEKHGVSQTEAEQIFTSAPLLADDVKHSQHEMRFQALGQTTGGRYLHVSFTLRQAGKMIRIISARDMNRKERARYDQET